ncbi:MAG: hypothetical protein ACLUOF_10190 [Ruminococcus sp.]
MARGFPGLSPEKCDQLNPIFFRYITTKMPYTILKYASCRRRQDRLCRRCVQVGDG